MQLGYQDIGDPRRITYRLPRDKGESRTAYAQRFFAEMFAIGSVRIIRRRGRKERIIAIRHI